MVYFIARYFHINGHWDMRDDELFWKIRRGKTRNNFRSNGLESLGRKRSLNHIRTSSGPAKWWGSEMNSFSGKKLHWFLFSIFHVILGQTYPWELATGQIEMSKSFILVVCPPLHYFVLMQRVWLGRQSNRGAAVCFDWLESWSDWTFQEKSGHPHPHPQPHLADQL